MGSANLIPVAAARHITQVAPVTGSFHGRSGDLLGMAVHDTVEPECGEGRPLAST
jgi:hypothetical protein